VSFDSAPFAFTWNGTKVHRGQEPLVRTHTYVFKSTKTGLRYILHAEEFTGEIIVLKFYCARHKGIGEFIRYSVNEDAFEVFSVCNTVGSISRDLLERFPKSSFGMIASRGRRPASGTVEPKRPVARFRVWRMAIARTHGFENFIHYEYELEGGYLLINPCHSDPDSLRQEYTRQFSKAYPVIHGI